MVPDDVLLAVFDFCIDQDAYQDEFLFSTSGKEKIEAWRPLVHVCRRWRNLVFGSPHRLNLRLVCTAKTPARDTLDVWPAWPLLIRHRFSKTSGVDNIIAAMEHNDRVCRINLRAVPSSHLEKISAAMQDPFPEITELQLSSYDATVTVLPDSFVGGCAPRLRFLSLYGVPFPGLPKLLLSATHLVDLYLWEIPHSGYISPHAMVAGLSALSNLKRIWLNFQSPQSCPDWESQRPPPLKRSVLPSLTRFWFKGVNEYLEDLVAHIDVPRLTHLDITFFNQIVFDTPQLVTFISRTPTFTALASARAVFADGTVSIKLSSPISDNGNLDVAISCIKSDWQLSSLEQVCTSAMTLLSTLEDLYIFEDRFLQPDWQDNIENTLWLELLRPFTSVKNLYLSEVFAPRIAPVLQELVGGRTTEVLPTLENIFLEGFQPSGPVYETIGQFVFARQSSHHPVTVCPWGREYWRDYL